MSMTSSLRKLALTMHIASSVGWLGAVISFLALAIASLTDQDTQMLRAAYLAMALIGWYVIVPLCLVSLLTGLIQSVGTRWGLFRHYWVLVKLLITLLSALILFGFTQTLGELENLAVNTSLSVDELRNLQQSPVFHSGGGLVALLVTTTLSVYMPWGMTPYGRRRLADQPFNLDSQDDTGVRINSSLTASTSWRLYVLLGIIGLILLSIVVLHLTSGGAGVH